MSSGQATIDEGHDPKNILSKVQKSVWAVYAYKITSWAEYGDRNCKGCGMEWNIVIHDGNNRYVEVITSGFADRDGSLNMAKAITHTMQAHRITKALVDHRNIEDAVGDTIDIYDRPRMFRLIGVILRIKIAEIIKPEHLEHFRFFETVCLNQGYQLSVFQDKDKALAWLLA